MWIWCHRFLASILLAILSIDAAVGATYYDFLKSLREAAPGENAGRVTENLRIFNSASSGHERALAALFLGIHFLPGQPERSLFFLTGSVEMTAPDDPIIPIIKFYRSKALLALGRIDPARRELTGLLADETLGSAWLQGVMETNLLSLYRGKDLPEFAKAYGDYEKKVPGHLRDEGIVRTAAIVFGLLSLRGQQISALEELALRYPTSDDSRWAFRQLLDLSCEDKGSDRYFFSHRLLTALGKNASSLEVGIDDFIVATLKEPIQDADGQVHFLSELEQIQVLFDARLYDAAQRRAVVYFDLVRQEDSIEHRKCALLLARLGVRRRQFEDALRYFSYLLFRFPNMLDEGNIKELIADSQRFGGNYASAQQIYGELAGRELSPQLRWNHFWMAYLAGDNRESLKLLMKPGYVTAREDASPGASDYWHGKIFSRLGEPERANKLFRRLLSTTGDGFYSNLLMAMRSDLADRQDPMPAEAKDIGSSSQTVTDLANDALGEKPQPLNSHLRLVLDFLRLNLNDQAQMELRSWNQIRGQDPLESNFREAAARRVDDYHILRKDTYIPLAGFLSRENSWRSTLDHQVQNRDLWMAFFPKPYLKIVSRVADELVMDPYLIWSIMRAESNYNANAISQVGARGLLQIMPYTAQKISKRIGAPEISVRDLLRPDINISLSGWYLKRLVTYYSENLILAIAAYNAGPKAVNAWLERCKTCRIDEFVESIPFDETRAYVKKVLTAYARYHRIYENNVILSSLPKLPTDRPQGDEAF